MSGMDMDKWSERGRLFLSNVRMVMVANRDGGAMKAFDAPLVRPPGRPSPLHSDVRKGHVMHAS